jgi:hypothetical protein
MDKYKEDKIWLNSPMKLDIDKLGEWDNRWIQANEAIDEPIKT